ncbi:OmpH family outer membrane protein [Paludibacterium paludis]|uniref:Outer membrane protein chaperone n=1 Tax=Paludibacterium paludis TaxID=1225769 RepID=A0A918UBT0_9NEIS|nr:OmpH family outer membrane protein [Paludibacterium paludis]GGY25567.1 outer membrane protein chaperone [Paludibacterium paludis]
MKLNTSWLIALLGLAIGSPALADGFKMGYISTERIYREGAPFVAIMKRLDKEFADRRNDLKRMESRGKDLEATLGKSALAPADRKNFERELDSLDREYRVKSRELSEDFNQRRNEEFSAMLERANRIVKSIAEKEQYDLILQDAVYVNPKFDLTGKVLKELDK